MSRYEKLLASERPTHDQDAFAARHPPMPREKRAKLFAPFDALTGYNEALDEQEVVWQERAELGEAKRQELDDKLQQLWRLYRERKRGGKWSFDPPVVTVTYFDEAPEQGGRGLYRTVTGAVVKAALREVQILPRQHRQQICRRPKRPRLRTLRQFRDASEAHKEDAAFLVRRHVHQHRLVRQQRVGLREKLHFPDMAEDRPIAPNIVALHGHAPRKHHAELFRPVARAQALFFDGAKLLIAADCTAYAYANLHEDFMRGKITLIGCPKLDDVDYTEKLTAILRDNDVRSVTVVRMEVPCCGGLQRAAENALRASGKFIPWQVVTISRDGRILD